MFFSKDKFDLGAAKSRAVIDAVRCIEIFRGEPIQISSIKMKKPGEYSGYQDRNARFNLKLQAGGHCYDMDFRFNRDDDGFWNLEHGWMYVEGKTYYILARKHKRPLNSPGFDLPALWVKPYDDDLSEADIYGTGWSHRVEYEPKFVTPYEPTEPFDQLLEMLK